MRILALIGIGQGPEKRDHVVDLGIGQQRWAAERATEGRFDVRSGAATGAPAEVALATYPARLAGDRVELQIG